MNGKRAKKLRRSVTGDPDMKGRFFARTKVIKEPDGTERVDPKSLRTFMLHPHSERAQYQEAKKGARR